MTTARFIRCGPRQAAAQPRMPTAGGPRSGPPADRGRRAGRRGPGAGRVGLGPGMIAAVPHAPGRAGRAAPAPSGGRGRPQSTTAPAPRGACPCVVAGHGANVLSRSGRRSPTCRGRTTTTLPSSTLTAKEVTAAGRCGRRRCQVEDVRVQRADDDVGVDQPVGERAAGVRADRASARTAPSRSRNTATWRRRRRRRGPRPAGISATGPSTCASTARGVDGAHRTGTCGSTISGSAVGTGRASAGSRRSFHGSR